MGLPGSLATKLINSQMRKEMEAEHIAGDSFLNSSSWSLPGHSLGYGAPSVSTFSAHEASHPTRPAALQVAARDRLCTASLKFFQPNLNLLNGTKDVVRTHVEGWKRRQAPEHRRPPIRRRDEDGPEQLR